MGECAGEEMSLWAVSLVVCHFCPASYYAVNFVGSPGAICACASQDMKLPDEDVRFHHLFPDCRLNRHSLPGAIQFWQKSNFSGKKLAAGSSY
jgi:hypothetical protein